MKNESAIVCALALSNVAAAASLSSSLKLFENNFNRESINQAAGNAKGAIDDALGSSSAAVIPSTKQRKKLGMVWTILTAKLLDHTILATQHGSQSLQSMKERLAAVEYDKLPDVLKNAKEQIVAIEYCTEIKDWIQEHPYQTAFYVANGIVFIAPGLVTSPLLGLLGFGSLGPKAGSAASVYHGTIGNVPKGALFALFQSAGSGGYGAGIVNGVAQGSALFGWTAMVGKAVKDSKAFLIEPEAQAMGGESAVVDVKAKL
ncbi:hypothetical protein MMC27_003744 [Xylographa pallens]|nr:hypothetical protein [Xylographa pallens]